MHIYSPISGKIISFNKSLEDNASAINSSPYSEGWVYTIEPDNWLNEVRLLSMADKYIKWLPEEFSRVKDFFSKIIKTDNTEYSGIVMQDGGQLKDQILAGMGPEVWDDFQTEILDKK